LVNGKPFDADLYDGWAVFESHTKVACSFRLPQLLVLRSRRAPERFGVA
jgi:hypothetical protein